MGVEDLHTNSGKKVHKLFCGFVTYVTAATGFSEDTPYGTITFLQMKLAGPSS